MKTHLVFAAKVVGLHALLFAIWFLLAASRVGATEHAHMFNEFTSTLYDRVLEIGGYVLVAPIVLIRQFVPTFFRTDMVFPLLLNSFLIGFTAFTASALMAKRKRTRSVSDG
jgi:hypothetical protein